MQDFVIKNTGVGRALYVSKTGRLYISKGYNILYSDDRGLTWQLGATLNAGVLKAALAMHRIPARLLRYYVASMGILSDGTLIAVGRDGIYRAAPGEVKMCLMFKITRGSRPLNITIDDNDRILFGEYGDLPKDKEIFIYASDDSGRTFHVAYTFNPNEIRHLHNVIWDRFDHGYWIMVGDFEKQPGIGKLSKDLKCMTWMGRGSQDVRAVGVIVEKDYLYYGTDSELSPNHIIRMDKKNGKIDRLLPIVGSSLYATRFGDVRLISTNVEPSRVNRLKESVIYISADGDHWQSIISFKKDHLNGIFFQYGTVVLPVSDYPEAVGMFSGQALMGCDNKIATLYFGTSFSK